MKSIIILMLFIGVLHAKTLKIATYNIRNFDYDSRSRVPTDLDKLETIIRSMDADIIAVQEIRNRKKMQQFLQERLPNYSLRLSQCGGQHGQLLGYIYKHKKMKLTDFSEDLATSFGGCNSGSRPVAIGEFQLIKGKKMKFQVFNLHLKSGGARKSVLKRMRQLGIVQKIINQFKASNKRNIIITGDLNTTNYVLRNQYYEDFMRFINKNNYTDTSAEIQCTSYWWGGINDGLFYGSILDHIILSQDILDIVEHQSTEVQAHCKRNDCEKGDKWDLGDSFNKVSDHCPILTTLRL